MAQNVVDFSDNPTGAQLMDDYLAKEQQNVLTSNSGLQRPSYAVAGTLWLNTSSTPWQWFVYDGTDDILIGTVNPTTNKFEPAGVDFSPYQTIANLSQTIDTSTGKYPSNKAVKEAIDAKDSLPSQTGNSGKTLLTDGENAYWGTPSVFDLFDNKWADHILNNTSWLRADTFSWQNGEVYKSAYEHLVEDFNKSTQKLDGVFVNWKQPILTANTTATEFGDVVVTASGNYSGYDAWKCMNGIKSGTDPYSGWGTNNTNAGWIQIVFPYKLLITGLRGYQRYDVEPPHANTIGRFYTSSDKTTPIGDEYINATSTNWNAVDVTGIPSEGIITDTIYFEKTSATYGGFGELEITAKRVVGDVVSVYQAEDGHKIVLPDQESAVQTIYEETGVAWYYILDTANKRFKLPRTKYGFVGLRDGVGNYVEESLPNITGTVASSWSNDKSTTGAFKNEGDDPYTSMGGDSGWNNSTWSSFDDSRSSSTYQDGAKVQQSATQMYLYFYVGNYTKSAIEQTAGLNSELFNGKMDGDMSNMNPSKTAKETIVSWCMPDYSNRVQLEWNTEYVATENGVVTFNAFCDGSSHTVYVNINGQELFYTGDNKGIGPGWTGGPHQAYFGMFFIVGKGDTYKVYGGSGHQMMYFYPMKGEAE